MAVFFSPVRLGTFLMPYYYHINIPFLSHFLSSRVIMQFMSLKIFIKGHAFTKCWIIPYHSPNGTYFTCRIPWWLCHSVSSVSTHIHFAGPLPASEGRSYDLAFPCWTGLAGHDLKVKFATWKGVGEENPWWTGWWGYWAWRGFLCHGTGTFTQQCNHCIFAVYNTQETSSWTARQAQGFFTSECIIDIFLSFCLIITGKDTALGCQAKLFVCVLSVENKINTFWLAALPYQVLDELKVWLSCSHCHWCWIILWRLTQTIMGRHWTQLCELGESYDCHELFTHSNQG